jgi:Ni/Co efflux regulator RcnB
VKKLLSAAIALSLLGGTAYAAKNNDRNDRSGDSSSSQSQQKWSRGSRIPDQYRQNQYRVNDWQRRKLQAPPSGYGWYRNDSNQYLLAALATGIIAAVIDQNQYGYAGYQYEHQWARGEQLSAEYRDNRYVVSDWRGRNLRRPGWRQEWVQVNNQLILIKTRTGMIVDVIVVSDNRYNQNGPGDRNNRDYRGYRSN